MEEARYSEIQSQLRDYARMLSLIIGTMARPDESDLACREPDPGPLTDEIPPYSPTKVKSVRLEKS